MAWPAVRHANAAFEQFLEPVVTDSVLAADVDSANVRPLIASYDSTVSMLPAPLRARAYRTLAPIWVRWDNPERAAAMFRALFGELAPYTDTAAVRRERTRREGTSGKKAARPSE